MELDTLKDDILVAGLREVNPHIYKIVFEIYNPRLLHYALKSFAIPSNEVEDLISDTWVALFRKKDTIESQIHLTRFLFFTLRNKYRSRINRIYLDKERCVRWCELNNEEYEDQDANIRETMLQAIVKEINEIEGQAGVIIRMYFIDGLKPKDISQQLNISVQTVMNVKYRVIQKLKQEYPSF